MTFATLAVACGRSTEPEVPTSPRPSTATADCPEPGHGIRNADAVAGAAALTVAASSSGATPHRTRPREDVSRSLGTMSLMWVSVAKVTPELSTAGANG